jgi:hypothetical protein
MERRFLGRVASIFLTAVVLLLAGARLVLDLIGYSTVPEDVAVAQTRLDQILTWFLSLPWWVPVGFALVATLWLMWVSWPRERTSAINNEYQIDPWVATGQRTYAKVKIDIDNWRADAIEKENIYALKVSFVGRGHKNIEMVVIFDRWVPNPRLRIACDRKEEGYRTEETALDDRYAICHLFNIKVPCVIELSFD